MKILNEQVKLAANILDRCPACMSNLVRHICEFSCSPSQSEFMKVVETNQNKNGKTKVFSIARIIILIQKDNIMTSVIFILLDVPYITSIDLHITEEYINKTYKSCSQVGNICDLQALIVKIFVFFRYLCHKLVN